MSALWEQKQAALWIGDQLSLRVKLQASQCCMLNACLKLTKDAHLKRHRWTTRKSAEMQLEVCRVPMFTSPCSFRNFHMSTCSQPSLLGFLEELHHYN